MLVDGVGSGLGRALYSTFVSYLAPSQFSYPLTTHADARGRFVEFIRTPQCVRFRISRRAGRYAWRALPSY